MLVYHGSDHIIEVPVYHGSKRTNDYGYGFYTTENIELAKEWACADQRDGFVNIYELDLSGLKILRLNSSEYNILNWLAILAKYRSYWQNGSIAEEAKEYLRQHFYVMILSLVIVPTILILRLLRILFQVRFPSENCPRQCGWAGSESRSF